VGASASDDPEEDLDAVTSSDGHWHPYLRVERAIRPMLSTRWTVHNRVTAKKA